MTFRFIGAKQLPSRRRRSQLARPDLLAQLGQQRLHTRLHPKIVFQAGIDALPHPRQGLLLATHAKAAIVELKGLEFAHRSPKAVHDLVQKRAELDNIGVPNAS